MATNPAIASPAEYIIRRGDTGYRIARDHNLTVSDLTALNPGVVWSRLTVGQKIRVRAVN